MAILAVSESEAIAVKVVSNTSPTSCGHRVITYEIDGVPSTLRITTGELETPLTEIEAERVFIVAWMRYRQARGKSQTNVRIV